MAHVYGELQVQLIDATFKKDVEIIGTQDPYAILTLSEHKQRSKTIKDGGKTPAWNQGFKFPHIYPKVQKVLKVEVYDENRVFRDTLIGSGKVLLDKVASQLHMPCEVPIMRKDKERGRVRLELTFSPEVGAEGCAAVAARAPANGTVSKRSIRPGNWILPDYADRDVWQEYKVGAPLGQGTLGPTCTAQHIQTGEAVAIKCIKKSRLVTAEQIEDVRREVQVMHHLAGHPNVVAIRGVYENQEHVYIVMEQCTGGELFDAIVSNGRYAESHAAALIRTIVGIVSHCHNMNVIHRDLKPENFILTDSTPNAVLKARDFRFSCFYKEGQVCTDPVGSDLYMAPEVLKRSYGKEADMWSCGVILYILLCGYPPFRGQTAEQIFEAASRDVDFRTPPWPHISDSAKDCIMRMLQRDPKRRATAAEILKHEWMREHGCASDAPLQVEVVSRMKQFSAMNRLKKEAMKLIAKSLPIDEISGMRNIFSEIDRDKNGTISLEEFREAMRSKGALEISRSPDLPQILKEADVDGNGTIDYEEFLAATVNRSKLAREELLKEAFARFDADGNGEITRQELVAALSDPKVGVGVDKQEIDEIFSQVDTDKSGSISYHEFLEMMRC